MISSWITLNANFLDLISSRHSIRSFKDDPIPQEKMNSLIDASTKGPSAGNLQSYQIFVMSEESKKQKLVDAAHGQDYVAEAPIVMIFCADPKRCSTEYGTRGEDLFCIQDATISCAYTQITAQSLGLSSVWIGSFDEEKVSKILDLPNNLRPVAILPVGFSNETPEITGRRPIEEMVHEI